MMAAMVRGRGPLLSQLLEGLAESPPDLEIAGLALDSRALVAGGLFLACGGARQHGLDFIDQALAQGAAAVAWEPDGAASEQRAATLGPGLQIPLLRVERLSRLASLIAGRFYGHPSRQLDLIGITGTNGKTSVSHLLAQVMGRRAPCGIVGTLGVGLPGELQATGYTTPDAVRLQAELAGLLGQGCRYVAMEVSSHALDQGRADALTFDSAVFTNISRDHFDYHGDMQNYAAAKQRLFHMPGLGSAVINLDDPLGSELLGSLAGGVETLVYSLDPLAVIPPGVTGWVRALAVRPTAAGLEIELDSHWGAGRLHSPLLGRFNAANLLAVLLLLLNRGWGLEEALAGLAGAGTVAGRMEAYGAAGQPRVVIDYAHTPDALEKALQALRVHSQGRLLVVFGCGGDRDRGKRPLMGRLAERLADRVLVTDDNPRSESSAGIIQEILAGMQRPESVEVVADRGRAIARAVAQAAPDDLVLVAGKGHEDYQLVGRRRLHFSDREQVLSALAAWGGER